MEKAKIKLEERSGDRARKKIREGQNDGAPLERRRHNSNTQAAFPLCIALKTRKKGCHHGLRTLGSVCAARRVRKMSKGYVARVAAVPAPAPAAKSKKAADNTEREISNKLLS